MSKKIPYRETEDYIISSVTSIAETVLTGKKETFCICDLGCGNGDVLVGIVTAIVPKYLNVHFVCKVIDIDPLLVEMTHQRLKALNLTNLSIQLTTVDIFLSRAVEADLVYVFWRRSDLVSYNWDAYKCNSTVVSYKHQIPQLKNHLREIRRSNSRYHMYENLYVYG